jgi:uncharacterized membrane protein SirB2
MDSGIAGQIGFGVLAIVVGLSGWLLPYRWNLLRLKRGFAQRLSDHVNRAIPKVVGTILIVLGILILFGTIAIGRFR